MRRAMTTFNGSASLMIGLVVSVLMLTSGCQRADWDNPTYIRQQLRTGNLAEQKVALKKLSELKEKEQKKAIESLVDVYNSGNLNQEKAMELLVKLRSPKAKKAYMKELKHDEAGYAGAAAEALGEVGASDAIPEMLEFYRSTKANSVRKAILRGFTYMPDKRMIDPLIKTLSLGVDNHQIAMHAYSCEILGDIAQKNPEAFDESDTRALVRARFLSNLAGQSVQKECSIAIQQLGEKAVPVLVETFKGENEAVNKLLLKYRNDSTQFPPNKGKVGAIQSLTAMRAEEAIDLYIESLKKERETPESIPRKFVRAWWTTEAQTLDEMILGLGDLGAEKAQGLLVDTVTGEMNDTWQQVLDYRSEMQLRQDAAFALVRLGARDTTGVLMKMAETGVIKGLERRARALAKRAKESDKMEPMSPVDRYQFNWMVAKAYSFLGKGDEIEALESLIKAQEGRKELKEKLESFVPALKLAKKCHAKSTASAKASCFGEKLDADSEVVRKKAAWELNWLPQEAAAPVLVDNLGVDELGTREIVGLGLYRNPSKEAIDKIDTLLEEEAGETSDSYKRSHYRLRLLRAWLKNHFA